MQDKWWQETQVENRSFGGKYASDCVHLFLTPQRVCQQKLHQKAAVVRCCSFTALKHHDQWVLGSSQIPNGTITGKSASNAAWMAAKCHGWLSNTKIEHEQQGDYFVWWQAKCSKGGKVQPFFDDEWRGSRIARCEEHSLDFWCWACDCANNSKQQEIPEPCDMHPTDTVSILCILVFRRAIAIGVQKKHLFPAVFKGNVCHCVTDSIETVHILLRF